MFMENKVKFELKPEGIKKNAFGKNEGSVLIEASRAAPIKP